jgi:serine/threonine protein kinase
VTQQAILSETGLRTLESGGRRFVCGEVPYGEQRGRPFAIAQPLAGRYKIERFFASGGTGLLLQGRDLRTGAAILTKSVLHYDVAPFARYGDRDGFANQLRAPRKTLEVERRILVMLRNQGCDGVPHPSDFVFDANPLLRGPYPAEDGQVWAYDDEAMIAAEPYLIMDTVAGRSLDQVLTDEPMGRLSEARSARILRQVLGVLAVLHQPRELKPGMIWRLVYQDLKPANLLVSEHDRVTVLDMGGCQLANAATGQMLLQGACTPGYCPPECEQPYMLLTPAADIYSVGATWFHLLTGRSPLEFLPSGLPLNQARSVRLDLNLLTDRCRSATREVIQRCLAPDLRARYPNIEQLRHELDALAGTT